MLTHTHILFELLDRNVIGRARVRGTQILERSRSTEREREQFAEEGAWWELSRPSKRDILLESKRERARKTKTPRNWTEKRKSNSEQAGALKGARIAGASKQIGARLGAATNSKTRRRR